MRKPISTLVHGVLDYLTATSYMVLPSVLGFDEPLRKTVQMVGVGKLCVAMCTDHELGIVRKIPMPAHLALDCVVGATLCALPFVTDQEDDQVATTFLLASGLFDIAAAPLTQTRPTPRSLPREAARATSDYASQAAGAAARYAGEATREIREIASR
jgi:hypothetical protein